MTALAPAIAAARTASLRAIVEDCYRDGVFGHTAYLRFLDALDNPEHPEARRAALYELACYATQWEESADSGPDEVAMLRAHVAPDCTDDMWTKIRGELHLTDHAPQWHQREAAWQNAQGLLSRAIYGGAR